jgi:hypothetical protein
VDDPSCLFCEEVESVAHLFFDYVVVKKVWGVVPDILGVQMGADYESIASLWLCNKKFCISNIFSAAICWCLWKLRNCLCFQGGA